MPLALLAVIGAVFVLGRAGALPWVDEALERAEALAGSPWGVPALVGLFCVGAFLGIPQFVLMGIAVAGFGPWLGMAYAWLATLCSGALTFWTGRLGGEGLFKRYAGARALKLSAFLGRNAFKASALVRLVPSGPFIAVNMAFGMSGARFSGFLAGLAIGAMPKLALIALAGQGLVAAQTGAAWVVAGAVGGAALLWGAIIWIKQRQSGKADDFPANDT